MAGFFHNEVSLHYEQNKLKHEIRKDFFDCFFKNFFNTFFNTTRHIIPPLSIYISHITKNDVTLLHMINTRHEIKTQKFTDSNFKVHITLN